MTDEEIFDIAEQYGWMDDFGRWNFKETGLIKFALAIKIAEWVGLTDEEIKALPSWWPSYEEMPALMRLVRDIEAKLKEKNGG
jgi:hypothetical protein